MENEILDEITNLVKKPRSICFELQEYLNNPDTPLSMKQTYFMDNGDAIKDALTTLNKVIVKTQETLDSTTDVPDELLKLLNSTKRVLNTTKSSIEALKQEMAINKNVSEEDLKVSLTEESMQQVTNEQQDPSDDFSMCNYVIMYGDTVEPFFAHNKYDANMYLDQYIKSECQDSCNEIRLFHMALEEIPLKKQVTYVMQDI